uniref:Strawberry notch homolog 1 (Drosophila) n=1 Tax=Scleropages formosus TaxID=113540 RepID=A0A8C9WJ56_SCLFO
MGVLVFSAAAEMDPGQDLLLAALSESGISPNDLFDISGVDAAQPATVQQESVPISALDIGVGTETVGVVRQDPAVSSKPQPSTTTFVLNQLNQLPSLGTIVVTKPSAGSSATSRQTITVAKLVHTTPTTRANPTTTMCEVVQPTKDQIQLKDLLKTSSLEELMKLKPPPNIAQPVATATTDLNNGLKKEVTSKDVARIWVNDDVKMRSFSPTNVSLSASFGSLRKTATLELCLLCKNFYVTSFKYGKISSKHNGSVKKGVIFATYSSLIGESQSGGKYKTRFKQLLHWCGSDFDGVIVFDECHKAKNVCPIGSSKPTKTGLAVLELQNNLPKARVVYASATGASEPRNMAYMNRLGIWGEGTPFKEFSNFIQAVERRGVGAMEIVAMDMKLRGMYIARQLSFAGVTFKIEEVPLTDDYIRMYNKAVRLWVSAREKFQQAANLMDAEQRMKKSMWGQFWSAHQRFFKYLCIASKVRRVVQLAREEVKNGKCVVIGLQSTGEARTLEALEEGGGELNDFVSTAKGVMQSLVEKHFPAPDRQKLFSLLGIDLSAKKTPSPNDSAATDQKGKKRKGQDGRKSMKKPRISGGLSGSSSEESGSDSEPSEKDADSDDNSFKSVSSGDEDDFNPFRDESSEDEEDDPWLIRKEHKKNKEKESKKKKSIDPDSIQSALLASGLGSTRPAFTAPVSKTVSSSKESETSSCVTSQDAVEVAQQMKRKLLEDLEELAEHLPPNTLDELIDELGGPDSVAEMTGRKGRVVSNDDGSISYESRSELDVPVEILNLTEKQRFMEGEKNIAIISEAASSGISLQADRRVKNQRRRVHMTLELPWSADRAIQQFGRTHRSNQVTAPEYVFLISELAGEQRFASIVAKRLESLGALTHGDRRATETRDLSRFNFDNKYGRNALEIVMKSIVNLDTPLVSPPANFEGDFFKEIRHGLIGVGLINVEDRSGILTLDKDYNNIGKFLNRILGMEVQQQNALFQYFSDTLTAVIQNAKKNGRYDMGILDLGSGDEKVKKIDSKKFLTPGYSTSGHVELSTVSVERGMSWEDVTHIWAEQSGPDDGFYVQVRNNKKTAILVKEVNTKKSNSNWRLMQIFARSGKK